MLGQKICKVIHNTPLSDTISLLVNNLSDSASQLVASYIVIHNKEELAYCNNSVDLENMVINLAKDNNNYYAGYKYNSEDVNNLSYGLPRVEFFAVWMILLTLVD